MSWIKQSAKWLDTPDDHTATLAPFRERGHIFLKTWMDVTFASIKKMQETQKDQQFPLTIGVGFEYDGETHAHRGAMLSIKFGDREPIFFRPGEMRRMLDFIETQFDDEDMRDLLDVDDFVSCLENGIKESEKFSKEAKKQ